MKRAPLTATLLQSKSGIRALPTSLGGVVENPGRGVTVRAKNMNGPVPDIMRTKFKYITQPVDYTTASVSVNFTMNDLVDPEQSGGGTAVGYYFQFSRLYQNFRVYASSIKIYVDALNAATQSTYWFLFPMLSVSSGTIPSTIDEALQFPNQKHIIQGPDNGNRGHMTLKHYCEVGALAGIADIASAIGYEGQMSPPPYSLPGTGPAIEEYWVLRGFPSQSSGAGISVDATVRVELEYYCELFNVQPMSVNPSLDVIPAEDIMSDSIIIQKFKDALSKTKPTFT